MRNYAKIDCNILDSDLSLCEKMILIQIARFDEAYPSLSTLAKLCGTSKKTIQRSLDLLIEKNIILKKHRFNKSDYISNTYEINYNTIDSFVIKQEKQKKELATSPNTANSKTKNNIINYLITSEVECQEEIQPKENKINKMFADEIQSVLDFGVFKTDEIVRLTAFLIECQPKILRLKGQTLKDYVADVTDRFNKRVLDGTKINDYYNYYMKMIQNDLK